MCLHPASLKGVLQTQAGGNPVCPAGVPWCVATPDHARSAEIPCCSLGDHKTFSFHKMPRKLRFHVIRCDQNLTALIICIRDEQVKLQWGNVFLRFRENGAQDARAFWWCSRQCACLFVQVTGDRYVLITCGHLGQIYINQTWSQGMARYQSHTWIARERQSQSLWPTGVSGKGCAACPRGKIWHRCCKIIEINPLNPSYALNFFCSILSQW